MLNKAYAFVVSSEFQSVAKKLRDGLVEGAGFDPLDVGKMIPSEPSFDLQGGRSGENDNLFDDTAIKDDFRVPLLMFNYQGELQLFTEDHFLNLPWPLEDCDATMIDDYFVVKNDADTGELDINDQRNFSIKFVEDVQEELAGVIYEPDWTQSKLVKWLCLNLKSKDVTQPSAVVFFNDVVDHLIAKQHAIDELARYKYRLRDSLREYISQLREKRQNGNYNALFELHAGMFALSAEQALIFNEQSYSYNQPYKGTTIFNKHFTSIVGDLASDGEEFECAVYLDRMNEVKYWMRNVDRQKNAFWLQLPVGKFYPDFIALLKDGRILVVEYKGAHLYQDATIKRQIGEFWADISEGQCLFCMPTNKNFNVIDKTISR